MNPFVFDSANAVAIGTFNIHIFTPPWIVRCGVAKKEPGNIEFALARPGFRVNLGGAWLTLEPHRIEVSTHDSDFNCGNVLAKILRTLPETPVFAMGANVGYQSTIAEGSIPPLRKLPSDVGGKKVAKRTIGLKFEVGEGISQTIGLEQFDRMTKATGNREVLGTDARMLADAAEYFPNAVLELRTLLEEAWTLEFK
ncbi:hypothetical protein FF011L_06270 [Roseimaritima multifibrata]|uniref:Uncharacterized protein n=1 Tax=Roseimaritima multifibrata TaxID=1930274 RepID=A0A517MAL0_9BACT|nr:hypothetical protein [Roseimaritima multifibrata]QDS91891.1 hypothetical protein FF011L_06270 [Roseimaritima multifibrata]